MVQVSEIDMDVPYLPQVLELFSEMDINTQHVAALVDEMLQRVRNGEISTDQGLSFIEMKYNMLLSYLINLTYVILRKCSGEKIEGDPCIVRLTEIRTILEKIRPIDSKLKYQINKLVKSAVAGNNANEPTMFKANPEGLINTNENEGSDESGNEAEEKEKKSTDKFYVPPKHSAVFYLDDDKVQQRNQKNQARNKKQALSSSVMDELREEYLDTPTEVKQSGRAQFTASKQQEERERYEEEYLTRLPVNKKEKHMRNQLSTLGSLGDEIVHFGGQKTSVKRKQSAKHKNKKIKRKRFQ